MRASAAGWIIGAVAIVAFGCSDSTGPRQTDSYVLLTVDGHSLPANHVVADTFLIDGNRIVGRTLATQSTAGGAGIDVTSSDFSSTPESLPWDVRALMWDFHCDYIPQGTACSLVSAPTTGTIRGDTLEFVANNWNVQRIYVKR